nr:hypothetical protein 2 [Dicistroviridae sp.]
MSFDTMACRNSIATNYNSMNEQNDLREPTEVCDQIQSVTISAAPESTGVTTFVQEACTAVSAVDSSYSETMYPVQQSLQDVREYFRRPVCIGVGNVGSNRGLLWNKPGRFVAFVDSWAQGINRLLGAYGIRAKMVVTLQVAATPFHQGLLCLAAQYGAAPGITSFYDRAKDPCTATNLPHVVLDLSVDTSVQLHLPYIYVAEYSDIRNSYSEISYVNLSLSNLCSVPSIVGMGPPTYQIYLHLEDIELFGATPQATNDVVLNVGRKLSPVTEEFERDSHPFSSALHAAGKSISFLAKGVPSISSIGGPVSWALGKAAGVVRYFGYGKATVTDPVMRMVRYDTVGEFNTDVATSSMVVAATAANTTSINTGVGASDVDEMSLSYVTSRWAQINVFDLATTSAAGTLIYATPITPLAFWFRLGSAVPAANIVVPSTSSATSNSVQPSHIMFAASSFKQWRGGLKFRFIFAKTKMHAGRVMVNFNPYFDTVNNTTLLNTPTTATVASYGIIGADPYGYSAIFDLKDGNVFEFKVPYVCPAAYANLASITGALAMYVVNPLIASSVVSTAISVIVQVAGDVDFELANPTGVMFPVHNRGTIRLNAGRVLSEAPEVFNQLTMGESITSVKQLIAIPGIQIVFGEDDKTAYIPPWYLQPSISPLVPAVPPPLKSGSFHYGGNWASCYTFLKGGTDVHIYDERQSHFMAVSQLPCSGGYLPNTATPDNRSSANAPIFFTRENVIHARLPAFFPTARVFSWFANNLDATDWITTNPFSSGTGVIPFTTPQAIYVLKADNTGLGGPIYVNTNAADDAQLAMYIGPPPIYLPPASIAGPFDQDSTFIQGN